MPKLEGINIDLNMDTGKLQRKLSAIAKHTEALAQELKEIDESTCPECGSEDVVIKEYTMNGDSSAILSIRDCICNNCKEVTRLSVSS